jgi:hypothetical protein
MQDEHKSHSESEPPLTGTPSSEIDKRYSCEQLNGMQMVDLKQIRQERGLPSGLKIVFFSPSHFDKARERVT